MLTAAHVNVLYSVRFDSSPVTGVTNGSSVTLHVSDATLARDYARTMIGVIRGSRLVLSYPGPRGTFVALLFQWAPVSVYNRAVDALNTAASRIGGTPTCGVLSITQVDIVLTVQGPHRWATCKKIGDAGQEGIELDSDRLLNVHGYTSECSAVYRGDVIAVYDRNGPYHTVKLACAVLRQHRMPTIVASKG